MDFIKNLFLYIAAINYNAFTAIISFISDNLMMLLSLVFLGYLCYEEIRYKNSNYVDDEREMY